MNDGRLRLLYPEPGSPLSVILKLPGESCNINCSYCYEKRKPYPSATQLSPETLRRFLSLCGERPLRVELHGGEPLLVRRPRMAALLHELRQYPGRIWLAIQTNGTLLDDAWLRFFQREWPEIDIGVSLDGDAAVNDVYRIDYRDCGTGASIETALRRLGTHAFRVGVIAVVTRASLGQAARLVEYFSQFPAIRFVKFAPCFDFNVTIKTKYQSSRTGVLYLNSSGQKMPEWATSPLEYADFVIDAFDAWKAGTYRHFVIEPLYSVIQTLAGARSSFCHFSESKCAYVLTLYPDGRLGSCDELRMPGAFLAHIDDLQSMDDVLGMQTNAQLATSLGKLFEKCNSCSYHPTCRGGCLATRLQFNGTPYDDEYCASRAKIIEYVAEEIGVAVPVPTG